MLQNKNKTLIIASLCFLFGSTLFLPQLVNYATVGVYLFMLGSALMLVDTLRTKEQCKKCTRRRGQYVLPDFIR